MNRKYELFRICTPGLLLYILNKIYSLGEHIPIGNTIRKLLSVLPESCESKAEAITKARDLDSLAMDELIGNLTTYELKKNQEKIIGTIRKDKTISLKTTEVTDYKEENLAIVTKMF